MFELSNGNFSDNVSFRVSHPEEDLNRIQFTEPLPIPRGPRIKEITSNCSSLATSPQSNSPSPPKRITVNQRNKSQNDILGFPNRSSWFFAEHEPECTLATVSRNSNSSDWPGESGDISQVSVCKCKFVIESDSEDSIGVKADMSKEALIEAEGWHRKEINRSRVFSRSISLDPVASGEVVLPKESFPKQFVENDFPLKVGEDELFDVVFKTECFLSVMKY